MKRKEFRLIYGYNCFLIVKDIKKDEWRLPLWSQKAPKDEWIYNSLDTSIILDCKLIDKDINFYVVDEDNDTLIEVKFYEFISCKNHIVEEYLDYKEFIYASDISEYNLDDSTLKVIEALEENRGRLERELEYGEKISELHDKINDLYGDIEIYDNTISKLLNYIQKYSKPNSPKFHETLNLYGCNLFEDDEITCILNAPTYYDTED